MNEGHFKLKITATAELQALKESEKRITNQIVAARAAGKSVKDYSGELRQLAAVQGRMKAMGFSGRLKAEGAAMAQNIPIVGRLMTAASGGAGLLGAGLVAVTGAAIAARKALKAFSTMEDIQTTFVTLLGSRGAAKERMNELTEFAAATPFELPEVSGASRVLENLTDGALSTGAGLRMVGDTAAAVNAPFQEVSVTLGRLYQGLRDGTPVGEAKARMTELTGINLRQVESWDAVTVALSKYNGEMERRSATVSGKESTFFDSVSMMMAQAGRPLAPAWKSLLSGGASVFEGGANFLQEGFDTWDRNAEALAMIRGEGEAAEETAEKVKTLAEAQEDAGAQAKALKDAVAEATQPLDAMAEAASRARVNLDALRTAQEKLGKSKIDADVAAGRISPTDAKVRKTALETGFSLQANTEAQKAADAELAKAKEIAEAERKKLNTAQELSIFQPSPENTTGFEKQSAVQEQVDALLAGAERRVDRLKAERAAIENRRDTENLQTHAASAKVEDGNAEKREALNLEVRLSEAKAAGNTAEEKRLQWIKDYAQALQKAKAAGLGDGAFDFARRSANASIDKDEDEDAKKKFGGVDVSSLAARGGSVGESLAAAREDAVARAQEAATDAMKDLAGKVQTLNGTMKKPLKVTATYGK